MTKKPSSVHKKTKRSAGAVKKTATKKVLPSFVISQAGTKDLEGLLAVLRDAQQPVPVRLSALQSLGAANFASPAFPSIRGNYLAALREVAKDPDFELRQRSLGILSREKDGFAQKVLLEGIEDPEKALVPPEKALQLLGNDLHSDAYPVARKIVKNPPTAGAKREALRLLAGDAASAPTFEAILRDKNEAPDIRQISGAALHALKPERLQASMREILLDPSEKPDMHETSLMAMTQFGAPKIADDKELMSRVDEMSKRSPGKLRTSARQFLGKYSA